MNEMYAVRKQGEYVVLGHKGQVIRIRISEVEMVCEALKACARDEFEGSTSDWVDSGRTAT